MTDTTATPTSPSSQPTAPLVPSRIGHVWFSPMRTVIIGLNTFIEAIRQKVYYILLVIALLIIAVVPLFREFHLGGAEIKLVLDGCLGAMTILGLLIAIVGTAQLLPREVENRTIYTLLAKPVRRSEFILGKFVGSLLLILLTLMVFSVMSGIVVVIVEQSLSAKEAASSAASTDIAMAINKIRAQAYNPDLINCVLLIFVEILLLASITLFFSTFSTSMIFNVVMAVMVYLAGIFRGTAIEFWGEHKLLMMILSVVPDLSMFNVSDLVVAGKDITWAYTLKGVFYGLARAVVFLIAGHLIFTRKEI